MLSGGGGVKFITFKMKWKISSKQKQLLEDLFRDIPTKKVKRVLDVGSGRTSIQFLVDKFKTITVMGLVYPGDKRKLGPIQDCVSRMNYEIIERDFKNTRFNEKFDVVLAHLFLGEATKFGSNTFEGMLRKLFSLKTKYLVIVDLLFDPGVDYNLVFQMIAKKGKLLKIIYQWREGESRKEYKGIIGFLIELNHE